jgi:hypothetical protein
MLSILKTVNTSKARKHHISCSTLESAVQHFKFVHQNILYLVACAFRLFSYCLRFLLLSGCENIHQRNLFFPLRAMFFDNRRKFRFSFNIQKRNDFNWCSSCYLFTDTSSSVVSFKCEPTFHGTRRFITFQISCIMLRCHV